MSGGAETLDLRGVAMEDLDMGSAAEHLRGGGLLAYPTETVYGFGGLCTPQGVAALRALKPRGSDKPFLVLAGGGDAGASRPRRGLSPGGAIPRRNGGGPGESPPGGGGPHALGGRAHHVHVGQCAGDPSGAFR